MQLSATLFDSSASSDVPHDNDCMCYITTLKWNIVSLNENMNNLKIILSLLNQYLELINSNRLNKCLVNNCKLSVS